jgi:hypothetical protein
LSCSFLRVLLAQTAFLVLGDGRRIPRELVAVGGLSGFLKRREKPTGRFLLAIASVTVQVQFLRLTPNGRASVIFNQINSQKPILSCALGNRLAFTPGGEEWGVIMLSLERKGDRKGLSGRQGKGDKVAATQEADSCVR